MASSPVTRSKNVLTLATKVAEYLQAQSVGTLGTDLWIANMPEDPVNATAVIPTGGPVSPDDPTRRPSFQILHRNKKVSTGLSKVVEINNLLENQWNVLTGFSGRIIAVSEAGARFTDDSGHSVFPLNYVVVTTTQT